MDVRLTAIHVLGMVGHPEMLADLRQLAVDCTSDILKGAIFETISKLEIQQAMGVSTDREVATDLESNSDHNMDLQPQGEADQSSASHDNEPAQPDNQAVAQSVFEPE